MHIIGKFRDYYDSAMAHGIDKDCKYIRETREIAYDIPKEDYRLFSTRRIALKSGYEEDVFWFMIGYCGQVFRGLCIDNTQFIYSQEEFDKWKEMISFYTYNNRFYFGELEFEDYQRHEKRYNRYGELFIRYKVPLFIIGRLNAGCKSFVGSNIPISEAPIRVFLNPELKSRDFARVCDPYTAFQDIHMYISGVLGGNSPEMVKISNKDLIKKHGFDDKSFRKSPGKRGKNKL